MQNHTFAEPIDGISLRMSSDAIDLEVRAHIGTQWTSWERFTIEKEFDPLLRETSLVLFPAPATTIEIRGMTMEYAMHPIRLSADVALSSRTFLAGPRRGDPSILTREQWGADDAFLFEGTPSERSDLTEGNNGNSIPNETGSGEPRNRITDCEEAHKNFPGEFAVERTVTEDRTGKTYRWPLQYSPSVHLLVVHHTALKVQGDTRSGIERMQALYAYHSNSRGWGDIGYHYVIDEEGQIYEGKEGGARVVGGHVYCGNIGTVGVALMGNFELEKPSQEQMKSLQWLLDDVRKRYGIDLDEVVRFHGKPLPAIVGHRELVSTDCPGYYVKETLEQVRVHVRSGDLFADVRFPEPVKKKKIMQVRNIETKRTSRAKYAQPRRVQRNLNRQSSQLLRRRLRDVKEKFAPKQGSIPSVHQKVFRVTRVKKGSDPKTQELMLRIRLETRDRDIPSCRNADLENLHSLYRGTVDCREQDGTPMIINTLPLEEYLWGIAEEPDSEPWEKQRAFAIAARSYAAYYSDVAHRKFPGKPYDGSDSPMTFQAYGGRTFERKNPQWVRAVNDTASAVLFFKNEILRAPYFSSSDGRSRSPSEAGWKNFPFAEIFSSKPDPWCEGKTLQGHGVGMSGCGARGQAEEGKTAEEILQYYYPGTALHPLSGGGAAP
jgi:hypothetical protein